MFSLFINLFADEQLNVNDSVDQLSAQLFQCEICEQEFDTKQELHSHILCHLGQPRVVLKRIPSTKISKKKHESYQLDPDVKGALKFKLKKQTNPPDSLKLTLKKSSLTKDFTIINSNVDSYNTEDVAGNQENDTGETLEETSQEEPFKDMTNNEEVQN